MTQDQGGPFSDPGAVARYTAEALHKVPGLADLHRMAMLLLAEGAGAEGRILVLGAGGGMELRALAEAQPGWRFVGIDPSAQMLALARQTLGPLTGRVDLVQGYADDAPPGPFDGAICLLTLHFLDRAERLRVLRLMRGRMRPGAHLVVAHHTAVEGDALRWLSRSAAFAQRDAMDPARAAASGQAMAVRLPLLTPPEEEALLREAGFSEVALFYAGLSFRGWVAAAGL